VLQEKKRILLAEDDADASLVLKDRLESFGYEVTAVTNGHEAIEEFIRVRYAATVMDVNMPEVDGLEALRLIKRIQPSMPVIMITSVGEYVAASLAEGAHACLLKPVDAERLKATVEQCLLGRP
jgi:two-component system response regulator (stage 0 sporulation protein F)